MEKAETPTRRPTTAYQYDALDNRIRELDADGNAIAYTFNDMGLVAQVMAEGSDGGVLQINTYDPQVCALSQVERKTDGSKAIMLSNRYDKSGNLVTKTDGCGINTKYIVMKESRDSYQKQWKRGEIFRYWRRYFR